jgi:catalase (peroxidase I)
VCSPVFVSQFGVRSGTPWDLEQEENELALGAAFYAPKVPRKDCGPAYKVSAVVEATRELFRNNLADTPASVRMGFHDAGDFNKWAATGGADGRFVNSPEGWYGQSRSVNAGTVCAKQLLGRFTETSLSAGDAVQLCGIVAAEVAGGPAFESFNFSAGRAPALGVTGDGTIPNPNGSVKTIRDYYYRMGLGDLDIVALMGAHTLGGGNGAAGSGYTGQFTATPGTFDNSYFVQLLKYEADQSGDCDYWHKTPAEREGPNGGCHVGPNQLLQLPTDRALLRDPEMRSHVIRFALDQDAFFEQYAASIKKMSELGKDVSVQWCTFAA